MAIRISRQVGEKLRIKHGVDDAEIAECFSNREGRYLMDTREEHKSDPPTLWFIAETNLGRKLKVVFVPKDGCNHIRTAYEANAEEIRIYTKYAI